MSKANRGPVGLAMNSSVFCLKGKCTERACASLFLLDLTQIHRGKILREGATKMSLLLKAELGEDCLNAEKHFLALCLFRVYPDVAWELPEPTLMSCGRAARLLELSPE